MELVIIGLFWLLGTRFSRFFLKKINPNIIGKIFAKIRPIWKGVTRDIKAGVRS
jgi:hypothetical protein